MRVDCNLFQDSFDKTGVAAVFCNHTPSIGGHVLTSDGNSVALTTSL